MKCEVLQAIDWYGEAAISSAFMPAFLRDWTLIASRASTDEQKAHVERIRQLALQCEQMHGSYLRFSGD